jgi:hypothetical protein
MLSKCANPGCSESFRYLGEGRLFQVERTVKVESSGSKSARKVEHYWLCGRCSQEMRIGILENEAILIFTGPDGSVNTSPIDTVHAA